MMEKKLGRVLIVSGGKTNLTFANQYLASENFDTVVCADAGLNAADRLGVSVDYVMGDFDSVDKSVLEKYRTHHKSENDIQFVQYPTEKDATDTHMVLDWVLANVPTEIVIVGATGGRIDHLLANINILMDSLQKQIPTYIVDEHNKIYVIDHCHTMKKAECYGKYISFLPLTERVSGVCLSGFRYEVHDLDFVIGDSLGVSNEFAENVSEATIDFKSGIMIVVESKD